MTVYPRMMGGWSTRECGTFRGLGLGWNGVEEGRDKGNDRFQGDLVGEASYRKVGRGRV